jgi:hypothetical protein
VLLSRESVSTFDAFASAIDLINFIVMGGFNNTRIWVITGFALHYRLTPRNVLRMVARAAFVWRSVFFFVLVGSHSSPGTD